MAVDKNIMVPIPKDAYVTGSRVNVVAKKNYLPDKQYNNNKRILIGQPASKTHMYPNDNYKKLYPYEYETATGKKPVSASKSIGLYLAVKTIAEQTGLSQMLCDSFGIHKAAILLDYAMYSIIAHSDVSQHFEETMGDKLLFSDKCYSDSYLSNFFSSEIEAENILKFKELWTDSCRKRGIASGYISVDGSNIDCESKGVEIAEKGKAKSGNHVNIINFMYAVSESDGTPITYMVYRGSVVDSKALDGMSKYLKAYKIRARGLVLDRGFCYQTCTDRLRSLKMEYVLMLKNNVKAFKTTADASGNDLKFNVQNRIPGAEIFGLTCQGQLFLKSKEQEYLHLYYDWRNGGERAFAFMDHVDQVIAEAGQALSEKKQPAIQAKYKDIVSVRQGTGPKTLDINYESYQKVVDFKGLYMIATSRHMEAADAYQIYHLRDVSEKQFMILKTQLGFDRIRTRSSAALQTRTMIAFVAAIIRNELHNAATRLMIKFNDKKHFTTNAVLKELLLLRMDLFPGDIYAPISINSTRQDNILAELGAAEDAVSDTVSQENMRIHGEVDRARRKKPGRKKKVSTTPENAVHRKRGRPKKTEI